MVSDHLEKLRGKVFDPRLGGPEVEIEYGEMEKDIERMFWCLEGIRSVLASAPWIGADEDVPEGSRYCQMSQTLVNNILRDIESITKPVTERSTSATPSVDTPGG